MTAQNFETLRARAQALGYELIVSDKGEQFVIESRDRDHTVEVLFIHRNDDDDDLEGWLSDQEAVSERVRQTARGLARVAPEDAHAVKLWRNELADDITRLGAAVNGFAARVGALDRAKAPIDDATRIRVHAHEKRLSNILGGARYEGVAYEDGSPAVSDESAQHADGIRLQAERVVSAYKELRAEAKSADFKSDDSPVGLFGELVTQIKALDGWLQPASAWTVGSDLALALLEDAYTVGDEAALESEYRKVGQPQNNSFLGTWIK